MNAQEYMTFVGQRAKAAEADALALSTAQKDRLLSQMSAALLRHIPEILAANEEDLKNAQESGMAKPMLDRLMLNETRIKGIADALTALTMLKDPVGIVVDG